MQDRAGNIGSIIAGVVAQALEDARADALVLIADGSPEGALAERLLRPHLGERLVQAQAASPAPTGVLEAWARAAASHPSALVAVPTSKTGALLGAALPGPLLPLGDLWASQVAALCGAWSAPRPICDLVAAAGGIDVLDGALAALVDQRRHPEEAVSSLPDDVAGTLLALWDAARFVRRRLGLVPKLGARTIGVDLFD